MVNFIEKCIQTSYLYWHFLNILLNENSLLKCNTKYSSLPKQKLESKKYSEWLSSNLQFKHFFWIPWIGIILYNRKRKTENDCWIKM